MYMGTDDGYWHENTGRYQDKKKKDTEEVASVHYKMYEMQIQSHHKVLCINTAHLKDRKSLE